MTTRLKNYLIAAALLGVIGGVIMSSGEVSAQNQGNSAANRQPFQAQLSDFGSPAASFTVPSNQRLVIEMISADCVTDGAAELDTTVGGILGAHYISTGGGLQNTRLYADPNTSVTYRGATTFFRSGTGGTPQRLYVSPSCFVTVSGYLTNP